MLTKGSDMRGIPHLIGVRKQQRVRSLITLYQFNGLSIANRYTL